MNEKEKRLHQCSKPIQKVIKYIESEQIQKKSKIRSQIHDFQQKLRKTSSSEKKKNLEYEIKLLREKLTQPYFTDWDADIALLLSKIDPAYQKQFIECSREEGFQYILPSTEDPHLFYTMMELGIDPSKLVQELEKNSLNDGRITYNTDENPSLLKFLLQCRPSNKITQKGLEYYLTNYKDIVKHGFYDLISVSDGLEALSIADASKYSKEILFHKDHLIKHQRDNGSIYTNDYNMLQETSSSLRALSLFLEPEHPVIKKGRAFLENVLNNHKNYKKYRNADLAIAALTLIELGDGPTNNIQELKHKLSELTKEFNQSKSQFLETSPNNDIKSIRDKLLELIDSAENEVLIVSPFIDMYSELVGRAKQNPNMKVVILTRPIGEFKGERQRFAKSAWETLNKLPNVTIKISGILHSRIIIVDGKKLLVSSADWTHDQLYDEFNAGLYTEDKDSIDKAKKFFKNCSIISSSISKKSTGPEKS